MKKLVLVLITLLSLSIVARAQDDRLSKEEIKATLALMSDYTPPSVQGVKIEGTVKELEKKFNQKGWTNMYDKLFNYLPESTLKSYGIIKGKTTYVDGVCVMEGYFLGKKSHLGIKPKSKSDLNVSVVGVMFSEDEDYVMNFVEYDVMPLVETYSKKYGKYDIEYSERYKGADKYTSSYSYGANHDILEVSFEDKNVVIRAFTNDDGEFTISVNYFNWYNYFSQLLKDAEEGDDYINDEI